MIVIEIILIGFAGYMLFLTLKMKNDRIIPAFFINSRINPDKAKDKEGFINYMVPRLIVFSVCLLCFSLFSLYTEFRPVNPYIALFSNIMYFACIIYYAVISVKAQNRFLNSF